MGGQNYLSTLVPARFLTTLGHLSVAIMVLYQMDDNVIASLPLNYTTSQYDTTHSSLVAAVALTIIFQSAELLSFFSGFSLFSPFINAYGTRFCPILLLCASLRSLQTLTLTVAPFCLHRHHRPFHRCCPH
jgi:hypothetical protein